MQNSTLENGWEGEINNNDISGCVSCLQQNDSISTTLHNGSNERTDINRNAQNSRVNNYDEDVSRVDNLNTRADKEHEQVTCEKQRRKSGTLLDVIFQRDRHMNDVIVDPRCSAKKEHVVLGSESQFEDAEEGGIKGTAVQCDPGQGHPGTTAVKKLTFHSSLDDDGDVDDVERSRKQHLYQSQQVMFSSKVYMYMYYDICTCISHCTFMQ